MPVKSPADFIRLISDELGLAESRVEEPFPLRVEDRGLEELAESIKRYGVLGPILVRPHRDPGWYEIVAGERRVRAAALAGLTTVPCRVKELSDEEVYEVAMVENVQREDLTDYEIARTLEHMINKFGYTHEQLAEKLEKSRTWVTNHLRILKLEKDYNVSMETLENITERQARMILSAPEEKRKEIIQKIKETGEIPSSLQIEAEYAPGPEPGAETPVEKPQEPLSTSVEPLAPGQGYPTVQAPLQLLPLPTPYSTQHRKGRGRPHFPLRLPSLGQGRAVSLLKLPHGFRRPGSSA